MTTERALKGTPSTEPEPTAHDSKDMTADSHRKTGN